LAIAAWSSGTGGAGLIGSFSYALLTEPSMGNLQPKVALLIQLFIPMINFSLFSIDYQFRYFFLLVTPDDVHTPGWHPKTWLVPVELPP
ncbi:hypothetical protein OSTOST_20638, partial [Ostertagia ostertagi]